MSLVSCKKRSESHQAWTEWAFISWADPILNSGQLWCPCLIRSRPLFCHLNLGFNGQLSLAKIAFNANASDLVMGTETTKRECAIIASLDLKRKNDSYPIFKREPAAFGLVWVWNSSDITHTTISRDKCNHFLKNSVDITYISTLACMC